MDAQKQDLLLNLATAEKDLKVARLYAGIDETLLPRSEVEKYRFDLEKSEVEVQKIRDRIAEGGINAGFRIHHTGTV